MALTKVTKSGITDNSIDADKIEDGTIVAADIADGTITNAKLAGSIANDKLANSSITVNGSSVSLGGSVSAGKVEWQAVKTADFNAVAGEGYFVNTTSGAITVTLPASPSAGDTIAIKDYAGTFDSNALTIARNGKNIQGVANNSQLSTVRASVVLVFIDDTKGWLFTNESNVADLQGPTFISATGGTVTTSGDYKIHSFTGDADFVVSSLGNPVGGPNSIDYLVVAGGGAGGITTGGGGGGAGGYRTSFPSPAGTVPVSATTYPVTVGAGGTGGSPSVAGTSGSPSLFSTITSTGGGYGGWQNCTPEKNGSPGGSGGGARYNSGATGGTGNTPPVSPSQGNNGGGGIGVGYTGGGGGGAAAVGGAGSPTAGGAGGAGSPNSISGSAVFYAGGGGGSTVCQPGGPVPGGSGGGGSGAKEPIGAISTAGTDNTGGGGGGGANPGPAPASNGGSGIVIIRYKFQ
jgi:hypothetical protein